MIKSILGGKSKNLFDISKVITSNVVKRNGNSLICSSYGTSIGTLGSICPTLKPSDLITISFKCASEGVPSNFMAFGGKTFLSGATFLVSEIGLSTPWYLYSTDYEHSDIPNKTTYSDIQVELGSTATEYVPHELTSYKNIMKVSDVCQLVDKSKFPDTLTKNGVTLTNNADGSLTLNGTPENSSYSQFLCNINTVAGHKYALIGIEGGTDSSGLYLYRLRIFNLYPSDFANPNIATATSNICSMYIQVMPNITVNNINCKPQLFDLTEMFGAGNEPTTVAEFKSKFPNEYYPYSPSCFVTSFDERMPCKTKNLFDISKVVQSNYIKSDDKDITCRMYGSSIGLLKDLCPSLKVGNTATVSLKIKSTTGVAPTFIIIQGQTLKFSSQALSFTATENGLNSSIYLYNTTFENRDIPTTTVFTDIMIELGDTATDYVPYGYV